ncbi:28S ribosomal protein S5, mitochondrial [Bonamia ostreae]|uniref:28S ribosomal protein S5, mitochondrial n=1 Tax=Bonamia ostreae TaxID=126728 RepID=A0ABV2AEX0_9EUKA
MRPKLCVSRWRNRLKWQQAGDLSTLAKKRYWEDNKDLCKLTLQNEEYFGRTNAPRKANRISRVAVNTRRDLLKLRRINESLGEDSIVHFNETSPVRAKARANNSQLGDDAEDDPEDADDDGKDDQDEPAAGEAALIGKDFYARVEEMGINAKTHRDHEARYEGLKRDYLRYRRKREYQRLLELGIVHRRPRRVTRRQHERFKVFSSLQEFLATGEYRYGKARGPSYLPGEHGVLVRRDIYERKAGELATLHSADSAGEPRLAKQPENFLSVEDARAIQRATPRELAEAVRRKRFATWEEKLEWARGAMDRLSRSIQFYEGLVSNMEMQREVESVSAIRGKLFVEQKKLRESPLFRRVFAGLRGRDEWRSRLSESVVARAREGIAKLREKQILLKREVEGDDFAHSDPFIGALATKMALDRERDMSDETVLEENPFRGRLVLRANDLQRNQIHLANPDLFVRFKPQNWRKLETDYLKLEETRDRAESASFVAGDEGVGAHKQHWHNDARHEPEKFTLRELQPWATAILNGLQPQKRPPSANVYVQAMRELMAEQLGDSTAAVLLAERFPHGRVDIEPTEMETRYLWDEQNTDVNFGRLAVKWFLAQNLGPAVGHAYNPFRRFMGPVDFGDSFTWEELLEKTEGAGENSLKTIILHRHRVSHRKKEGEIDSAKKLFLTGNAKGAVGFYYGKDGSEMGGERMDRLARFSVEGVPLYRLGCIHHNVSAKFQGTEVRIIATPPGYGLVASPFIRTILHFAGVRNATAMVLTRTLAHRQQEQGEHFQGVCPRAEKAEQLGRSRLHARQEGVRGGGRIRRKQLQAPGRVRGGDPQLG